MGLQRSTLFATLAAVVAAILFGIDCTIQLGVAFGVTYALVIWIVYFTQQSRAIWAAAVICSILIWLGFEKSPSGGEEWKVLFNRVLAWIVILTTAFFCDRAAAEGAHQAEQLRLKSLITAAPIGIVLVDPNCDCAATRLSYLRMVTKRSSIPAKPELRASFWWICKCHAVTVRPPSAPSGRLSSSTELQFSQLAVRRQRIMAWQSENGA